MNVVVFCVCVGFFPHAGYVGSKSFLQQLKKLVIELKEINKDIKFGKDEHHIISQGSQP